MSDVNLEYCHIYAEELKNNDFSELKAGVGITKDIIAQFERTGITYSLNVLVDNYFGEHHHLDIEPLRSYLASEGLPPDGIYWEADMATACNEMISNLKPVTVTKSSDELNFISTGYDTHLFRSKTTETLKSSFLRGSINFLSPLSGDGSQTGRANHCQHSSRTVIVQYNGDNVRYGCPLLSACWTLSRFGISPYIDALSTFDSIQKKQKFIGNQIITVLPLMYMNVESTVIDLLSNMRSKTIKKLRNKIGYRFY